MTPAEANDAGTAAVMRVIPTTAPQDGATSDLGDRNWRLPGWLDRLLPAIDVEGSTGLPEPEYEPVAAVDPAPLPERVLEDA